MFNFKYILLVVFVMIQAYLGAEVAVFYQIRNSGVNCAANMANCKRFIATPINQGAKKAKDIEVVNINIPQNINQSAIYNAPVGNVLVEGFLRSTVVKGETFYRIDAVQINRLLPLPEGGPSGTFYRVGLSGTECKSGAPCPWIRAMILNTSNQTYVEGYSNPYKNVIAFPTSWLQERMLQGGNAIVQGIIVNNKLELTAAYANLNDPNPPCPAMELPKCGAGQINTFYRRNNRCLTSTGCVTPNPKLCPGIVLTCSPGYRVASFPTSPNGCYSWYCDADFLLKTN